MSRHAGTFTVGVLAGVVYLAGSFSFSAMAEPPNFAHNPSIGWYAYNRLFIPPASGAGPRSEEHTSELQSLTNLVCRLLLEKKKITYRAITVLLSSADA